MIPYQVQDLKALLRSDLHSDITFLVDGHKITAHKVRAFQSVLTPTICFLLVKKKRKPICEKWNSFLRIFWIPKSQVIRILKLSSVLVPLLKFFIFRFFFLPILSDFSILIFTVHVFSFLFYFLFYLFIHYLFID